jgi:hypothetical protein
MSSGVGNGEEAIQISNALPVSPAHSMQHSTKPRGISSSDDSGPEFSTSLADSRQYTPHLRRQVAVGVCGIVSQVRFGIISEDSTRTMSLQDLSFQRPPSWRSCLYLAT